MQWMDWNQNNSFISAFSSTPEKNPMVHFSCFWTPEGASLIFLIVWDNALQMGDATYFVFFHQMFGKLFLRGISKLSLRDLPIISLRDLQTISLRDLQTISLRDLIQKVLLVGLFPRLSKFDGERVEGCQTFFV